MAVSLARRRKSASGRRSRATARSWTPSDSPTRRSTSSCRTRTPSCWTSTTTQGLKQALRQTLMRMRGLMRQGSWMWPRCGRARSNRVLHTASLLRMTLIATFLSYLLHRLWQNLRGFTAHDLHFPELCLSQDGHADLEDGTIGAEAEPAGSCLPRDHHLTKLD